MKEIFNLGMGQDPPKKFNVGVKCPKLGRSLSPNHEKWQLKNKYATLNGNILIGDASKDLKQ